MVKKALKFISPFISQIVLKDNPEAIHNLFKGLAYGQGGIALGFVLSTRGLSEAIISGFILLFPLFFVLGLLFGFLSAAKSQNGHLITVIIWCLLVLTVLHIIVLSIFLLSNSIWLLVAFVLSIILAINLLGYVMITYHTIKIDNANRNG